MIAHIIQLHSYLVGAYDLLVLPLFASFVTAQIKPVKLIFARDIFECRIHLLTALIFQKRLSRRRRCLIKLQKKLYPTLWILKSYVVVSIPE
jgi:hypothetical protein